MGDLIPTYPVHPTKRLTHPSGRRIPIDRDLAPLIRLLWDVKLDTIQCCQEDSPGLACIEFPGTFEVEGFLNVARRDYHVRIHQWVHQEDGESDYIRVRLLVLFPAADIPYLVATFRDWKKTFNSEKEEVA